MIKVRRALALALTSTALGASLTATAVPAEAASQGYVYLVIGDGACPFGGKVTGIWGGVPDLWSGGDSGDNVVYPLVKFNYNSTFAGYVLCSRAWYAGGNYKTQFGSVIRGFNATYNNQAIYR